MGGREDGAGGGDYGTFQRPATLHRARLPSAFPSLPRRQASPPSPTPATAAPTRPFQPKITKQLFADTVMTAFLVAALVSAGFCEFIIGFFLGAIPWFVGAILLWCSRVDYREKPGYVACTIAAVLATVAVIIGATAGAHVY